MMLPQQRNCVQRSGNVAEAEARGVCQTVDEHEKYGGGASREALADCAEKVVLVLVALSAVGEAAAAAEVKRAFAADGCVQDEVEHRQMIEYGVTNAVETEKQEEGKAAQWVVRGLEEREGFGAGERQESQPEAEAEWRALAVAATSVL